MTVCQRRLGLSEAEDTRLEKYSFLEDRMSLWRDLKEDQSPAGYWLGHIAARWSRFHPAYCTQPEYVSRCFQRGEGWTEMRGGWRKTMGLMETGAWRVC